MLKKTVSYLLIGCILFSSVLLYDKSTAKAAEINEIPNTNRVEKDYDNSFLSVTGYAASGVNDRTSYVDTPSYRVVTTAGEFLEAIQGAQEGDVKVIEVANDINFGWKEIDLTAEEEEKFNFIKESPEPTTKFTNPLLVESGLSEIEISEVDGLTIFSTSGNTLKHVEFKLQNTANDIIIRNLNFDGMWQWDDSGRHKEAGWGFITISGATNIWIDHCKFSIAADGIIDLKNGATNVTLTWNEFGLPANEEPDPDSSIYQSIHYMEGQYKDGLLDEDSLYYKMREGGATVNEIMAYAAYHSKVHLCGSGDKDYVDYVWSDGEVVKDANHRIKLTMAYNKYTNVGQRLPMIRQGTGHIFNNYFDNSTHQEVMDKVPAIKEHGTYRLMRGINARNGACIAGDTNVYYVFNEPLTGAERQGDDTGNMNEPWDVLFQDAKNHFLLVNSEITNTDGETYTGSSWDNNGDNPFTRGITWDDKSTIGNWAWSSSIVGIENMDKDNPPSDPFEFTYDYEQELPYTYQIVPLDSVKSVVNEYAGISKLDLGPEEWLKVDYTTEENSSNDSAEDENQSVEEKQDNNVSEVEEGQSAFPTILIIGGIVFIIIFGVLWRRRASK